MVTSTGRVHTLSVVELPGLPPTNESPSLSGGAPLAAFVDLAVNEQPLALCALSGPAVGLGLALGTAQGVVKRVNADYPVKDVFEIIGLKDGDSVVGAVELASGNEQLTFVSSDGNLLTYAASLVRPQGRAGSGMAGMKLSARAQVIGFCAVEPGADNVVVTMSGASGALPGTESGSVKVTEFFEYPSKGRATAGVRCHRFLRGEDSLLLGWVGAAPARAASANGVPVDVPPALGKRDGSGIASAAPIAAVASGARVDR